MSERLQQILVFGVLIMATLAWGALYVGPKDDVLMAATVCMDQIPGGLAMYGPTSEEWATCFEAANNTYGSPLLTIAGF